MATDNQLVIFDFDGVVVNTEYTTFDYYRKILPQYGIHLTEDDFKYKNGRKSIDFFRDVLKDRFDEKLVAQLILKKRKAFSENIREYLKPIEGAFDLIKDCHAANIVLAIGSQNERELIEAAVEEFKIKNYFAVIRSLQDITNKKPHPEIFLGIAKQLNIDPSNAVVLEDAIEGIQAAKTGGFKTIGITTGATPADLKLADLIVSSPKELGPKIIREL